MPTSPKGNASARAGLRDKARLRTEVYDKLAARRGFPTVVAQAELHGVDRGTLFRLRNGSRTPRLGLALRMAADLGTRVEVLFERVA